MFSYFQPHIARTPMGEAPRVVNYSTTVCMFVLS